LNLLLIIFSTLAPFFIEFTSQAVQIIKIAVIAAGIIAFVMVLIEILNERERSEKPTRETTGISTSQFAIILDIKNVSFVSFLRATYIAGIKETNIIIKEIYQCLNLFVS